MAVFGNTKSSTKTSVQTGGASSQTASLGDENTKSLPVTIEGSNVTGNKNAASTSNVLKWDKSFNDLNDSVDTASGSNLNWGDNSIIVSDWGIYNVVGNPSLGSSVSDTTVSDSTTGDIIPASSTDTSEKTEGKSASGLSQKNMLLLALIAGAIIIFKSKK